MSKSESRGGGVFRGNVWFLGVHELNTAHCTGAIAPSPQIMISTVCRCKRKSSGKYWSVSNAEANGFFLFQDLEGENSSRALTQECVLESRSPSWMSP